MIARARHSYLSNGLMELEKRIQGFWQLRRKLGLGQEAGGLNKKKKETISVSVYFHLMSCQVNKKSNLLLFSSIDKSGPAQVFLQTYAYVEVNVKVLDADDKLLKQHIHSLTKIIMVFSEERRLKYGLKR